MSLFGTLTAKEQAAKIAFICEEVLPDISALEEKFEIALKQKRALRVKLGIDPTFRGLHLGHTVVLRLLRAFQQLGHKAILLIGDTTGQVGDPSGRSATRPILDKAAVTEFAKNYLLEAGQVIDVENPDIFELRYNSEWLESLDFAGFVKLCSQMTVTRMLEREDFKNRFNAQQSISIHEFLYPLMQGYDSVGLNCDIECGGTDQRFNLLVGRQIQPVYGQIPQVICMMTILEGTDGVKKMSKSLGNHIMIEEEPRDMFGKLMRTGDNLIGKFFRLLTDVSQVELKSIEEQLKDPQINPRDIKLRLAKEVTAFYHGCEIAELELSHFIRTFSQRDYTADAKEVELDSLNLNQPITLFTLCKALGEGLSGNDIQRLIAQGGVRINGVQHTEKDTEIIITEPTIINLGKKKAFKLI